MSKKVQKILLTTVFTVVFVLVGMFFMRVETDNPEQDLNYSIKNGVEVYDIESLEELTK